jgi:hypothetical protein
MLIIVPPCGAADGRMGGGGAVDLGEIVAVYNRDGYVVVDDLVPEEVLEYALYGVERVHAGERDAALPSGLGYLDWRPGDDPGTRINDYVSLQNGSMAALIRHPPIAALASLLADTSEIRLFHDQVIYKDPGRAADTAVGFHTDVAYWHTCSSRKMLTAWIPLNDCSVDSGPLAVVPGSHRWSEYEDLAGFWDTKGSAVVRAPSGEAVTPVVLALARGQVSFHHCRTIHGSGPNLSAEPRCAVTVHLQDADNTYVEPATNRPRSIHVNDLLCRRRDDGTPDYQDPFVSPTLFRGSPDDARETLAPGWRRRA